MSKFTTRAIEEAFMSLLKEKSLDKISVKDIIEYADINRNTFYYHYEDIYDLLESIFSEEEKRFIEVIEREKTIYDQYLCATSFLMDHKDAICHLYNSKSREVLQHYLELTIRRLNEIYISKAAEGTTLSETGKEYIIHFYSAGISGAILQWIEKRMPEDQDGFMKTVCDSFEATIKVMIETYIKGHPEEC